MEEPSGLEGTPVVLSNANKLEANVWKISANKAQQQLTVVELAAQLVVRAAFHHFGHVLGLLVHRHGSDDSALRWGGQDFNLDGTRLGDLAVKFLQFCRVLKKTTQTEISPQTALKKTHTQALHTLGFCETSKRYLPPF